MSAADHLQGKQHWYHRSKANLTPGVDQIRPANDSEVGGSHYGYSHHDGWGASGWDGEEDRGDKTFAADTENEAEAWDPNGHGRPVTYVVRPPSNATTEIETNHYLTSTVDAPGGEHLKTTGPMDIVDRIDIPMPRQEGEVVQGTLPPQNWGHFNKLPDGYTGPATMGEQRGDDNFKRIHPAHERLLRENDEAAAVKTAATDVRVRHIRSERVGGQQTLFRSPYGSEGPEDWEKP